jgi:peptidoglycan/xylan/chitin deacetylase (PgdA/CDA1 family)
MTLQLPVAWMDAQLFLHDAAALDAGARRARLVELIDRAAAHRGSFVINIHDYVFDAALFPGWVQALRDALDHIHARGDFWLATPEEITRHWCDRYARLLSSSRGLFHGRQPNTRN